MKELAKGGFARPVRFVGVDAHRGEVLPQFEALFSAPLLLGEKGCALSHYRLWRKCAKGGKPLTIAEDDIEYLGHAKDTVTRTYRQLCRLHPSWDVIWFLVSYDHDPPQILPWSERRDEHPCTHFYIIHPRAASILVRHVEEFGFDRPVDEFMFARHPALRLFLGPKIGNELSAGAYASSSTIRSYVRLYGEALIEDNID